MPRVEILEAKFERQELTSLLHALRLYETHWSALVMSADHAHGREASQEMLHTWREARKLRRRIEKEIDLLPLSDASEGPASMDVY
ncbi:hypothetical protein CLG85_022175 [Yangia mangrovi]|uniref:Uncharacterized protein n=1 Tax=Alloyangia mangrovi TaxID=1779329 RepID=A0A2A3JXT2_9RHOB|nr:hypothetical protein [Alloyangia mangrovi]MCA0943192.1 hypothetical protein [Alloyangia pacifica]MCA0948390.1 hypothetical protein [Alloyangia pacifica]MCT4372866.1 hypothetical protein [Alloyangia mangrovi]